MLKTYFSTLFLYVLYEFIGNLTAKFLVRFVQLSVPVHETRYYDVPIEYNIPGIPFNGFEFVFRESYAKFSNNNVI